MSHLKALVTVRPHARALYLAREIERLLSSYPQGGPRVSMAKALARSLADEISLIDPERHSIALVEQCKVQRNAG